MKLSFSTGPREDVNAYASTLDLSELFQEPALSNWSHFGNGELGLRDADSGLSLALLYLGNNRFFADWHNDGRMVVYDGSDTTEFVATDMGGDPFRIPVACLISGEAALAALGYAVENKGRDPRLTWRRMDEVPFAAGWYDGWFDV